MNELNSLIAMARDMEISGNLPVSLSTTRWAIAEIERLRAIVSDLTAKAARLAGADCCEKAELLDMVNQEEAGEPEGGDH